MQQHRECGSCSVCCKELPIRELDKASGVWCMHWKKGKGCRIYGDRPQGCKDFACFWKAGFGEEGDRPDRIHVMIDECVLPVVGNAMVIHETRSGAVGASDAVRDAIQGAFQQGYMVWVRRFQQADIVYLPRDFVCPEELKTDIHDSRSRLFRYADGKTWEETV